MKKPSNTKNGEAGFTIAELVVAMTVTLVMVGLTSMLLAGSFSIRARENQRTEALADTQRGLNLMTREIANSGYAMTENGIVADDSGAESIRVRANLNASSGETTSNSATDRDEDIKYFLYTENGYSYIVRLDVNTSAQQMILANRVDSLNFHYYADKVSYTSGSCDIADVRDAFGLVDVPARVRGDVRLHERSGLAVLVCGGRGACVQSGLRSVPRHGLRVRRRLPRSA